MSADFPDYVSELLAPLGTVRRRAMFGGVGLYVDDLFCALIFDDCLYIKGDRHNEQEFLRAGCEALTYLAKGVVQSLRYYRVPDDALDNPAALAPWARLGMAAALRKQGRMLEKAAQGKTGMPIGSGKTRAKRGRHAT